LEYSCSPGRALIDEADADILRLVADKGPLTLSELARELGWSKSMIHRRLRRLASLGLVSLREVGGVVIVSTGQQSWEKTLRPKRLLMMRLMSLSSSTSLVSARTPRPHGLGGPAAWCCWGSQGS